MYFSFQGLYVSALEYKTFEEMFLYEGSDTSGELIGEWLVFFIL